LFNFVSIELVRSHLSHHLELVVTMPGFRQKRVLEETAARRTSGQHPTCGESVLATYLLQRWAWGWLSPQAVQAIAAKAKEDMDNIRIDPNLDCTQLNILAGLGGHGKTPTLAIVAWWKL